jgi:hypothetical protein
LLAIHPLDSCRLCKFSVQSLNSQNIKSVETVIASRCARRDGPPSAFREATTASTRGSVQVKNQFFLVEKIGGPLSNAEHARYIMR